MITINQPKMVHNFQFEQGCLLVTEVTDFNGNVCQKLYIQAIDAYRYQRELSIEFMRVHGRSDEASYHWQIHAYKHPGIREISQPEPMVAKGMINRLVDLATKYPDLLFNKGTADRARHEGFVHFHDVLLNGVKPNVSMIP